ncbi:MAG: 30S ribosomal protein S16 [Bacteroidetes bacterium]|nr:30S ribosomal protein S16 [Bacteroidota bacterium]
MIKLRLQRKGRKKRPYYHIVVADSRSPRDGRIIEQIGRYDNVSENKHVLIDESRAMHWLSVGAQPTDKVRNLLKGEGILLKMHLQRWGKTDEEIEAALAEWKQGRDERMAQVMTRKEQLAKILEDEEKAFKDKLVKKAKEAKEAAEAPKEEAPAEAEAAAEDAPAEEGAVVEATAEEPKAEDAPAEEAPAEEPKAEDAPAEEAPAEEPKAEDAPAEEAPAEEESKKDAPEA